MAGLKGRQGDLLFLAVATGLLCEGYGKSTPWTPTPQSLTVPFLLLAGFIGIMFPFRFHTRGLWIAASPFVVFALPTLGYNVHVLLYRAPGLTEPYFDVDEFVMTVACYIITVALWIFPGALGCRLSRTNGSTNHRFGLKPVFLLTGLVCCILAAFRATMEFVTFSLPATWERAVTMSLLQFAVLGIPIWTTFSRNWVVGVAVSAASIAGVCLFEWSLSAGWAINPTIPNVSGTSYAAIVSKYAWQLAALGITVAMIRIIGGYHLTMREASVSGPAGGDTRTEPVNDTEPQP